MTTPLDLAHRFLKIFYSGTDIDRLSQVLADDLIFDGPFLQCRNMADYLEALRRDPPTGMRYQIIQSFENATEACLVYHFDKLGVSIPMAQIFEIENEKISRIRLIFDSAAF